MRFYFDACCLNRLTDDHGQQRIRNEAEAIETLLGVAAADPNIWVGSEALDAEIARNPHSERREDAEALLTFAKQTIRLDAVIIDRARELQSLGFSAFDAMHLACAENGAVEVFLTTDDRLVRRAAHHSDKLKLRVLNPLSFLEELENAGATND
ncbi:MAG: PIN domain-containing protein [Acidobacteriaceae bacterium]|nr:PIN domain-containing protein [Acidobacteriaceae bacterium]MBV9295353.1 PIN domain-containing protein [Acidobacteriaceae bacterium]